MSSLTDARGVAIAPGDTALYGFGVGRSVALAEAVVLGEPCTCRDCSGRQRPPGPAPNDPPSVSLTPSGRVRLRVIRRSYSDGEKPTVDVAPDRLVVLKRYVDIDGVAVDLAYLPDSPLPTQSEEVRRLTEDAIASYTRGLRATETPTWWIRESGGLAEYHAWCAGRLAQCRKKLKVLEEYDDELPDHHG